jgi:hypothetical protein
VCIPQQVNLLFKTDFVLHIQLSCLPHLSLATVHYKADVSTDFYLLEIS